MNKSTSLGVGGEVTRCDILQALNDRLKRMKNENAVTFQSHTLVKADKKEVGCSDVTVLDLQATPLRTEKQLLVTLVV